MIKILIADDHPIVRCGLRRALSDNQSIEIIGEAGNGKELLTLLKLDIKPNVVLLDIIMPDMGGLEALTHIKSRYPSLPVLLLSVLSESIYGQRGLKAGASGFISKNSTPEEIAFAIKKVSVGELYISDYMSQYIAKQLRPIKKNALHETLTDREFQILRLIAAGQNPKSISEALNLSIKTVSTYKTRLQDKLNITSNEELLKYCYYQGLSTG